MNETENDGVPANADPLDEARVRAALGSIPTKTAFVDVMCEFLAQQGLFDEDDTSPIGFDRAGMRADAFNYNANAGALALVVADFSQEADAKPLGRTDIDRAFGRAENFLTSALSADFRNKLEESSPEFRFVSRFQRAIRDKRIDTVRLVLVSTRSMGSRTAAAEYRRTTSIPGIEARFRHEIWDRDRYKQVFLSRTGKEDIDIDCTAAAPGGIPCLRADAESSAADGVETYLAVLPGSFLADLYGEWSERLLEQNVRTFLQFKGGVNKGIRRTLKTEPGMFLAFNNGITATAEEVELDEAGTHIRRLRNLQIVNGGQTTASLFNARRDYGADLARVRVQMKLVVIPQEKLEDAVPRIAQYANTQNAVNAADFAANHPFQKRLQDLSRRISAPGAQYDRFWFYERTRGQYNNAVALAGSEKERERFKKRNPDHFDKVDAAKYSLSWDMKPDVVSLGGQKCFVKFMEEIKPMWDVADAATDGLLPEDGFNEFWFKELVAKAILFRRLDKLVMKQPWYEGFKANIVAYSVAKFRRMLEDRGLVYDLVSVWNKQEISPKAEALLLKIAERVSAMLHSVAANPTEGAKQARFWQQVQLEEIDPGYDMASECVASEKRDREIAFACSKQRDERSDKVVVESRGASWWGTLDAWLAKNLSEYHTANERLLRKASSPERISTLARQECAKLVQLEKYARQYGFDA